MRTKAENRIAWLALAVLLAINGAMLWPELAISRADLNDNVFHFALIERIAQLLERGGNPIDFWSPEWTLGYPVLRTYQPLAHLLVADVWLALGKSVALMTVFVWARFLSLVLLPLSFFAAARLLGFRPIAAAAAALLAPLISTNFLYGVEYGSFTWAGSGLYPQAVATHLLLISLGLGYRAVRGGSRLTLAGGMLGLAFLAHFIYGYIGALSLCLLVAIPDARISRLVRFKRLAWVGVTAAALCAFQILPLIVDNTVNRSRWEPVWKWDSFGPVQVLRWLFTGELLDHGRLPVLTLLAFAGAGWVLWRRYRLRETDPAQAFVLLAAGFWIAMFCGRPLWGPLLTMLGVFPEMQLHRVIGGVHIFLLLLASMALIAAGEELFRRRQYAVAALALAALLFAMLRERAQNLTNNSDFGRKNLLAYAAAKPAIDATIRRAKERGGRVFPGPAAGWGGGFKVGEVPFHALLSAAQVPAVAFLYHSMALTSDVSVRFDEWNPDHYRLFNVETVVRPAAGALALPPFLKAIERNGDFNLYSAPGGGYFDLVDAAAAVAASHNDFYDVNDRWLGSNWVAMRKHILLDWGGQAPASLLRVGPEDPLPPLLPTLPPGDVTREGQNGEVYSASVQAARACYALFKMTWHANWHAELDGKTVPTVMLSPGFSGIAVPPGEHSISMQYRPEWWRTAGPLAGILCVILLVISEHRGWMRRAWPLHLVFREHTSRRVQVAAGLLLLSLPVCLPLLTGKVLDGHDAFEYFPRLTEFHQNISSGILWPRWAPDLTNGNGQPLFLFNPPLIYFAGEFWHLLGFSFVTAMNLACAVTVLLSAAAMFLLGRLYFGVRGGWLASAALIYAPYFAVDLYVRSAMAEFAAFPFAVFALYGFGAFAKSGKRGHLIVGAAAYSGVILSHNAATLIFTPLLLAFIAFTAWCEGQWRVLFEQAAGFATGLGLGAAVWLPGLAERGYTHIDRLLQGYLRYSNHFVYLQQLFYSPWGFGISVAGANDEMPFTLGWGHLPLLLLTVALAARYRRWLSFFGAAGATLCFLMLPQAEWIWNRLPLLQYLEFPWRLFGPAAICLALLIAPLGRVLDDRPRWRTPAFAVAMGLLIVPNLSHMAARGLRDVDPTFWTPQQIAARGLEVTTAGEYTPRWVETAAPYTQRKASLINGDAKIHETERSPVLWSAQVTAVPPSAIQIATSYFPGWRVRLDGDLMEATPALGSGQIRFTVPKGNHRVEVYWSRTAPVWLGDGISLLALTALLLYGRLNWVAQRFSFHAAFPDTRWRAGLFRSGPPIR